MVTKTNSVAKSGPTKKIPAKSVIKSTTHTPTKKKAAGGGAIKSTTHTPTKKKPPAKSGSQTTTSTTAKKKTPAASTKKGTPVNFSNSNTNSKKKPQANTKTTNNKSTTSGKSSASNNNTKNNNNRSTKTTTTSRGNSLDISNKSHGSQRSRSSSRVFNTKSQSYRRRPSSVSRTPQQQEELVIRDLLGDGAYHLPGNNWCQDFLQYFSNTHPVFSVCCQHRLHPISRCMRAIALLGSIMVGLVITNVIYLLVIHDKDEQFQIIELPNGDLAVADENGQDEDSGSTFVIVPHENENEVLKEYTHPELDSGMLILWTVGSAVHAIWDNTIWYLTSCACVDESSQEAQQDSDKQNRIRKAKKACNILIVMGCILITAAATLAVIIRAHVEAGGKVDDVDVGSFSGNSLVGESISNKENYEFLISYGVELFVAWFLWFPIIETFLFSGVMGLCFPCVPCLAGRPGEIKEEANNNNNNNNNDIEAAAGRRRRGRGGKTRGCCW